MFSGKRARVRTWLAALVAAGLMLSTNEPLIPEWHDGDVVSAGTLIQQAGHLPDSADGPSRRPPANGHRTDATHVCHCTHPHGATGPLAAAGARMTHVATSIPASSEGSPPSPRLDSIFRPPIA